jgi:O-antigen ligase
MPRSGPDCSARQPYQILLGENVVIAIPHPPARPARLLPALPCAGVLALVVPGYPLGAVWLVAGLLLAAALQWRWPRAWLVLVPAALPVLDLAPWTGRFFVDEFDALLAVTVLVQRWRAPPAAPWTMTGGGGVALLLFCLSTCVSLAIGAWPFPAPGLNGLDHYYSPYNGMRLAKGLGWALLLWPLLAEALAADVVKTQRRFAFGMGLGVCAAALAVLWERALFPGVLNFTSGYRVVGPFSGMHIGGAYIEAYFAIALPFLAWWTLASRRWPQRLAGSAMLALGSYALLVTYARAGYLAAAVAMLVLGLAPQLRPRPPAPSRHMLRALLLFALLAGLGWVVANGNAMQRRYASSARDLAVRVAHWQDALRMIEPTPAAVVAGMGVGRYPATYFMRSGEGVKPAYQALQSAGGNTWLAMVAGAPLYVEQIVSLEPNRRYQLSFRARSRDADARLGAPVCHKWMLYSSRCIWQSVAVGDTGGAWRTFSTSFTSHPQGSLRHALRPVKLSLFGEAEGTRIDLDDVSLRDDAGGELLKNGGFTDGTDHWFFASDNHLPWHLENTWLQVGFEQGLAGLAAFAALVGAAFAALGRRLRAGDRHAPVLAAALAAFLALSPLSSVLDFPRISLIVYLLLLQAISLAGKDMQSGTLR